MKTRRNSKWIGIIGLLAICCFIAKMGQEVFAQTRPAMAPKQKAEQNFSEEGSGFASSQKSLNEPVSQRKIRERTLLSWAQTKAESGRLAQRILSLLSMPFWVDKLKLLWGAEGGTLLTAVLLFGLLLIVLFRFRRVCRRYQDRPFFDQRPFMQLAFELFQNSMPLFGITLFYYIYIQPVGTKSALSVEEMFFGILWIMLISRWHLDFGAISKRSKMLPATGQIVSGLRLPIIWLRLFSIIHLILTWLIGFNGAILMLGRLAVGTGFLIWYFRFLKQVNSSKLQSDTDRRPQKSIFRALVPFVGYIMLGGGLISDLMGYGQFSVYWLKSWAQTAAVVLWGGLFFLVLREWYLGSRKATPAEDETSQNSGSTFRWFFFWGAWLVWLIGLLVAIIFAWGGKQALVLSILKAFNTPFRVGSMQLSVMGFIYGFLIILITHVAVRFWRLFFQKKVLGQSDLETGLQESITTIAVYVFWGIGIVIALHAVGLNTTSMVVGLGALGIGLGFGLQNIFNNFISGIILLFERPIQVGDAVEINGVWATVKKINVRATVVQTWDNASLIIPNSEFISSQVTNWSFKDLRLRRNIIAGVAYGSDVELVRKTLLEIAANHSRVLKEPKPDVLFSDFGDSALIFRLRIWTYVDGMLTVESDLRFEIDRSFRERQITIAFPQRDLHIRSVVDKAKPEFKSGDEKL